MTICESGYYNKVTRICGERHFAKRFYHSFEAAHNFLLEGANVVLLRYFGIRRYRGNIKTDTVLMDGTICESIYVSQNVSSFNILFLQILLNSDITSQHFFDSHIFSYKTVPKT